MILLKVDNDRDRWLVINALREKASGDMKRATLIEGDPLAPAFKWQSERASKLANRFTEEG